MTAKDDTVSFGFREVPAADKARLVRGVFDSVASKYDLMNDLMSGFVHRLWKDAMVQWLNPQPGMAFVDIGGGTGDIAFRILDQLGAKGDPAALSVIDINAEMLKAGRGRIGQDRARAAINWVCGDAERLPLANNSVDAYTIAFCIRNVTRIERALFEARRVLKPGGRFLCLEFSRVNVPVLDDLYEMWSMQVLPEIGARVTGDRDSYRYLVESIRRFPDQKKFAGMITDAGLSQVKVRDLSGGIAALHSAWRI